VLTLFKGIPPFERFTRSAQCGLVKITPFVVLAFLFSGLSAFRTGIGCRNKMKWLRRAFQTLLAISMAAAMTLTGVDLANAQPSNVWVDDEYCDGCPNDGHTWGSNAFAKIQDGIDAVASTGSVHVGAGTFIENITLKDGVQVLGAGAELTTIDGGSNGSVVTANSVGPGTVLDGLTITNGTGTFGNGSNQYGGGVYISNSTLVVKNCTITENRATGGAGGIEAYNSTINVYNCSITQNRGSWGVAIALHSSDAEIIGNLIDENYCYYGGGIFLTDSSQAIITNNIISRTSMAGIGIGESSTASIINNTISSNSGNGIATGTYAVGGKTGSATITNCILWGNEDDLANLTATYSNIQDADPGEGNISAYPMFVDSSAGDYHLKPGSPCIDVGTNEGAPGKDLDGDLRPLDGDGDGQATVDMGADEYSGPASPSLASEVWVDNDYCDGCSNDGHTWNYDAFAKIQNGIDAVTIPGTVNVLDGTYLENIWLRSGVSVKGAGPEATTIDGGGNGSVARASSVGPGTALDGVTITNGTGTSGKAGTYGGGLYIYNSTFVVKNCTITENRAINGTGGIEAYNSTIKVYKNNISENRGWWGGAMTLHNSNAELMGNVFDNNECYYGGTILVTDSSQASIVNNRITRSKLGIGIGDSSVATVLNSTIVNNHSGIATGTGMVSYETGSATIKNCILWGNGYDLAGESSNFTVTYTDIEFGYQGEGNISSNPMFVDPENGDYHLNDYSPCVGAGTAEGAPDTDLEGNPRPTPTSSNPDMGAYENALAVPDMPPSDLPLKPIRLTNTIAGPDIAASEAGRIAVVWSNDSNPYLQYGIYYTQKTPGGSWSASELITSGSGVVGDPQIGYDQEETLHVVWVDYVNGSWVILYASKPVSDAWSVPVELPGCCSPDLAVGPENTVHVVWAADEDIVYTSKPKDGEWTDPISISGTLSTNPSSPVIAVNRAGTIGVVWDEIGLDISVLYAGKGMDGTWSEPVLLSRHDHTLGGSESLAAGNDGTIHVVWGQSRIFYSNLSPGREWSAPLKLSQSGYNRSPVLAIDPSGDTVYVTLIGDQYDIYRLHSCKGSMWFSERLFPASTGTATRISSAMGHDGHLHLVWPRNDHLNNGIWYSEYIPPFDSDGDCLSDEVEALLGTDIYDLDTDDDGISDADEDANHSGIVDDNETDPTKADTDDDYLQDGTELGITEPLSDPDEEGHLLGTDTNVFIPDADPTTTTDPLNPDTDGDGPKDGEEDINHNGRVDLGETDPNHKPLDLFGMELGNKWTYEGTEQGQSVTYEREITSIDQSSFPVDTYVQEIRENGVLHGAEYYERTGTQIKLWGVMIEDEDGLHRMKFAQGLLAAWFPAEPNDHQETQTTGEFEEYPGIFFNVRLTVDVLSKETVTLNFDTLEAYRIHYSLRLWATILGETFDETDTFTLWVVPYIGFVKDQDNESMVELTSFAIGGGIITEESDADGDNLTDYQEIFHYSTLWQNADSDGDSCMDGPEVLGGRDPKFIDPGGDVNADCALDLKDVIIAIQLMSDVAPSSSIDVRADVNGDGKIDLSEALYILQKILGLR
jgi:parallel beta-helix repeat protein